MNRHVGRFEDPRQLIFILQTRFSCCCCHCSCYSHDFKHLNICSA